MATYRIDRINKEFLRLISEMLQKMDWYQGDMEDEKDEE